ncbi:hypothetical protein ACQP2U_08075 [Nocardia sp. CA-084685]|uniref:hypothetical protein n=1 Tax=Nocardia sp. CA-084685 TaxID=3239970 RepID=UPI003D998743
MSIHHHIARSLLAVGALGLAALTGCSDNNDNHDGVMTSTLPTTSRPTSATSTAPDITPQATRQLCDMIGTEIDNWRDQGTTIAKVSFNGTVQDWAARNDSLNDDVIRDKTIIDRITVQTCPDVRQRALDVLHTDNLADALIGFGG